MYFKEDEILAQELQCILNLEGAIGGEESKNEDIKVNDPQASSPELLPNIHELFDTFNRQYFDDALGMVEVKWSPKMKSSSGRCYYRKRGRSCCIKLSVPLLAERPIEDVIDTLLHEMIHAYLFVTGNGGCREDHGSEFLKHMNRINREAGTNIAIYDNFEPGPTHHRKYIWRCSGSCRNKRPSFGFVRKTFNKDPGPGDYWWEEHQGKCGGKFTKISEPTNDFDQKDKQGKDEIEDRREPRDDEGAIPRESRGKLRSVSFEDLPSAQNKKRIQHFHLPVCSGTQMKKFVMEPDEPDDDVFDADEAMVDDEKIKNEYLRVKEAVKNAWTIQDTPPNKIKQKPRSTSVTSPMSINMRGRQVECPVCRMIFSEDVINEHVDECLMEGACMPVVNETIPAKDTEQGKTQEFHEENLKRKIVPCPICTTPIQAKDLSEHISECLYSDNESDDSSEEDEEFEDDEDEVDRGRVLCPCCFRWVPEIILNEHMNECFAFTHQGSPRNN